MGAQQEMGNFKAEWVFKLNKVCLLYSAEDTLKAQSKYHGQNTPNTLPNAKVLKHD